MNVIREKYNRYVIDTIYSNKKLQERLRDSYYNLIAYGVSEFEYEDIVEDISIPSYREWLEIRKQQRNVK